MSNYTEFGIFMTLLDGKVHKATDLAETFEVSTKTIYRQTNKLVYAGFPITTTTGKNGGIFLASKFNCSTWFFNEEELAYLLSIVNISNSAYPQLNEIICCKLKEHIKQHGLTINDKIQTKFFVDNSRWNQQSNKNYKLAKELACCCLYNKKIKILYHGSEAFRLVDPYCVVLKDDNYYLYAFCNEKSDFRLFRLDRISEYQATEQTYEKINIDLSKRPWNNSTFARIKITIEADTLTIDDIKSWAIIKKQNENSCTFEATHNIGLIHKLIEYGNKIKIISPFSIIDEITKECAKIINLYK
ncbi:MAG: WYL domain-containing protein [Clostridia bacterium]|nr:WYL domain-containing protein [Clostridia bacterium]